MVARRGFYFALGGRQVPIWLRVALRDETIIITDVNKRTHNNKLLIMIEG